MSGGNARAARPILANLEQKSEGKGWAEPVAALLAYAMASVGEVSQSRANITAFKSAWPESEFMPVVVVAEGKAFMQEGKRARSPGEKRGDPPNADQAGLYRKAIERWDHAIATWPGDPALDAAYLNKSGLLIEMGELAEAEEAAVALATAFPGSKNSPRALYNVARAAAGAEDPDTAERLYQRLGDDFPHDRLARRARSQLESLRLLGKEAPLLEIEEWLGDDMGQITDLKGKAVMLVFWATWNPHCRKEMPQLEELWQKHKDDDFVLIAVTRHSRGQTTDKVVEYVSSNGLTYPIAVDTGATSRAYGVSGIPAAALIDKDGRVVFRNHPSQLNDALLSEYL